MKFTLYIADVFLSSTIHERIMRPIVPVSPLAPDGAVHVLGLLAGGWAMTVLKNTDELAVGRGLLT
jgi:hypothetical protein